MTRAVVAVMMAILVVAGVAASEATTAASARAEPALDAHVAELDGLAAPFAWPTDRAPQLLLVGDSVADSFGDGLAAEATARGAVLRRSVRPGCGILPGVPTTRDGFTPSWADDCGRAARAWQSEVAAVPADVILLLSTWDGSTRYLGDTWVDPATPEGRETMVGLVRETVDTIAPPGSGRRVVLLAEAIPTRGSTTGEPKLDRVIEARHHRAVARAVARADRERVRVVDLGTWLCTTGPPCPELLDGITVRPEDGGHFSPEGAAWLAPRLLDALALPAA